MEGFGVNPGLFKKRKIGRGGQGGAVDYETGENLERCFN